MIADDGLRKELELCDRWGIPHSLFRGAGDGRWTARDRAKALAYQEYQRSVCPQCGTREADWDPDLGGDPYAYEASTHMCFGCEEVARVQKEIPDGPASAGMKVVLLPASIVAALRVQEELAEA
ncbi:hypothetical protein HY68_36915 [Streptomyces sp. AcH 505]|uniref:hypothetical protein n=1 Tax=Streptomyces sp. AcH 505 TaxID=352211 RepID=UPI000591E431|nr:hypothetical protein HY68_36915 [Streptomyces sp. AcH 505]